MEGRRVYSQVSAVLHKQLGDLPRSVHDSTNFLETSVHERNTVPFQHLVTAQNTSVILAVVS
jgi:hypothetical protein